MVLLWRKYSRNNISLSRNNISRKRDIIISRDIFSLSRNIISLSRNNISLSRNIISFSRNIISFSRNKNYYFAFAKILSYYHMQDSALDLAESASGSRCSPIRTSVSYTCIRFTLNVINNAYNHDTYTMFMISLMSEASQRTASHVI